MKMWEFLLRRLLAAIPVLLGVIVLIFFVTHVAPADPVKLYAGIKAPQATLDAIRARLHLNDPIPVQFWYYLVNLVQGNLGYSLSERMSVNQGIGLFIPITLGLVILAIAWSTPVGIFLGMLSATRMNKLPDVVSRTIAYIGLSFPSFLLAILLQLVFAVNLRILPLAGMLDPSLTPPTRITGFYPLDSLLTGNLPDFVSSVVHLILPVFALGFTGFALVLRMARSSLLETLSSPFVKALRAKGVPEKVIVRRYAFRAAMGPTLTIVGLSFGSLLGGTVFIEEIFGVTGFSWWVYQSIIGLDYNVVVAYVFIISVAYVLGSIVVDAAYAWIEPRIRFAEEGAG
jgi:peptide/nickel transport system permease protein